MTCYKKNTEKFQYLHKNSNHPISNFKSFIKGEGICILRNTNNESEFQTRKNLFIEKLLIRGYKRKLVEQILSKIKFQDRQIKLKKKNKVEKKIQCIIHYKLSSSSRKTSKSIQEILASY